MNRRLDWLPSGRMLRHALLCGAVVLAVTGSASAKDSVKLATAWLISGKNAPYFVAKEKGFYDEVDLDVSISRGNGSGDTIKRIAAGESDFGEADVASVISAQTSDKSPVKAVGLMTSKSSIAILYVKESGISSPQDLVGKKLGRSAAGASVIMYPGFLKANDIDREKLTEVVVNPSSFLPLMLSREVDAVLDQSSYLGRYRKGAKDSGLNIDAFRFADFGMDLYGNAIIVHNDRVKNDPELVTRFLAATFKGVEYTVEHPEEAIAILQKFNPEIDAQIGLEEWLDTKELTLSDEVAEHGLGYIDATHMEETQKITMDALGLTEKIPLEDIYTISLLPKKN